MKRRRFGQAMFALVLVCAVIFPAVAQTSSSEREALIEFYHATGGDDWVDNDGWLENDNACTWTGIQCIDGRIARIELARNNLTGSLPTSLSQFAKLRTLQLHGNRLQGSLPDTLINGLPMFAQGDEAFIDIDLSDNHLSGSLPDFTSNTGPGQRVSLILSGNFFEGPLPDSWASMVLAELDLGGNPIGGTMPESWQSMTGVARLHLASAGLEGAFPEAVSGMLQLQSLDLSGNRLSAELPDWLGELSLTRLDLDGNTLTGDIGPAVAAMRTDSSIRLHLADNRFSGPIPHELLDLSPVLANQMRAGTAGPAGLDLCWNDLEQPTGELAAFIDEHHHGGGFHDCQQPRQPIDPTISGSWFDPQRNGEGFVQHLLEDGRVLLFWFTYWPLENTQWKFGDQAWQFAVVPAREDSIVMRAMHRHFMGRFGHGRLNREAEFTATHLTISPLTPRLQQIAYTHNWPVQRSRVGAFNMRMAERLHQVPLTRLAGSTCDNQQPGQWISGAWYNPDADGEGFMVEVNEDGRGVVYWFTFQPAETWSYQAWMMGDGDFDGDTLIIDNLVQPTGTAFGTDFDPDEIEFTPWGSLMMEFDDDMNGHVWFDSLNEEYGSGDYPIKRLARPKLAECE